MQNARETSDSQHQYGRNRNDHDDDSDREPQVQDNINAARNRRAQQDQNRLGKKFDEMVKMTQSNKSDITDIKDLLSKFNRELEALTKKVRDLEVQNDESGRSAADKKQDTKSTAKLSFKQKKAAKLAEKRAALATKTSNDLKDATGVTSNSNEVADPSSVESNQGGALAAKIQRRTNRERIADKRRLKREVKKKQLQNKPPLNLNQNSVSNNNEDSTTQAAEASSDDRVDDGDKRDGAGKEKTKVLRRKKYHQNRRNTNRRGADSSERNSNDTSPQNETNGQDNSESHKKNYKTFDDVPESEMTQLVQELKDKFLTIERPSKPIKKVINEKGPKVAKELAIAILDYAICDVTIPAKLSEIANNLYYLLISEDNNDEVDFQSAFYAALGDISTRENDIAIDAPRYLDSLAQLLAICLKPMYHKQRYLLKEFLNKCMESYSSAKNSDLILKTMKSLSTEHDERLTKSIWDLSSLNTNKAFQTDDKEEIFESRGLGFLLKPASPDPRKAKRDSKESERFADDVTSLVEENCSCQRLEDLVRQANFADDEKSEYTGTLLYGVIRGCLSSDANSYKLDAEKLNKYSNLFILKEDQRAVALHALTSITKLWHQYNCPQDILIQIFAALHNLGVAPLDALVSWLHSENYTNVPGIGAARLNTKRFIEDLLGNHVKG